MAKNAFVFPCHEKRASKKTMMLTFHFSVGSSCENSKNVIHCCFGNNVTCTRPAIRCAQKTHYKAWMAQLASQLTEMS